MQLLVVQYPPYELEARSFRSDRRASRLLLTCLTYLLNIHKVLTLLVEPTWTHGLQIESMKLCKLVPECLDILLWDKCGVKSVLSASIVP